MLGFDSNEPEALPKSLLSPAADNIINMIMNCDTCLFYEYDEQFDDYYCSVDMDEDDYARMLQQKECPFWRDGDEYKTVRKQM